MCGASGAGCARADVSGPDLVEQDDAIAARSKLTTRACWWAIDQLREHASVNGLRRQLGTGWRTVWEAILPLLQAADTDPARLRG